MYIFIYIYICVYIHTNSTCQLVIICSHFSIDAARRGGGSAVESVAKNTGSSPYCESLLVFTCGAL